MRTGAAGLSVTLRAYSSKANRGTVPLHAAVDELESRFQGGVASTVETEAQAKKCLLPSRFSLPTNRSRFYACSADPLHAARAASASDSESVGWACTMRAMSSALPWNSTTATASAIRSDALG